MRTRQRIHSSLAATARAVGVAMTVLLPLLSVLRAQDTLRPPPGHPRPPGRLIDVGGYRLHLYCTGSGSPTVVIIDGFGDFSFDWALVQPGVASRTRVCSYDRA